jgi:CelD/BcsL family acetyltransferase involved in cellulose biosynthesis
VNVEVIEGHPFPETVTAEWEALLRKSPFPNPFLTPVWHEIWLKHFGKSLRAKVMVVRERKGNSFALGAFSQNAEGGDRKSLELLGSADVYDYRDLVFSGGREEETCGSLARFFEQGPWDLLDFRGIAEFSPTLKFLPPILRSRNFPVKWEEFLKGLGSKDRHELRRKMRRLEREAPYEVSEVKEEAVLPERMDTFLELHRKSRRDKAEFMTPEMETYFREVAMRFCERGWLSLSFPKVGGREIAAFLAFQFQGAEYVYNSGYDPEFRRLSPGIVLAAHCIRRAIERGTALFHFLRGREDYKYHLGAKEEKIYHIRAVRK